MSLTDIFSKYSYQFSTLKEQESMRTTLSQHSNVNLLAKYR